MRILEVITALCAIFAMICGILSLHPIWGGGDAEFQEWIKEKRKKKAFIMYHNIDDEFVELIVVEKCPVCGHVFTEEEYDELTFW